MQGVGWGSRQADRSSSACEETENWLTSVENQSLRPKVGLLEEPIRGVHYGIDHSL